MVSDSPATPESPRPAAPFGQTRWTLVLRANVESAEGRAALSELCAAYYEPVYRFLRGLGYDQDAARDHGHAFFAHLLERGFPHVDPRRGRFRSYLLGAVKYFVGDLRERSRRAKRGGGRIHEALDSVGELPGGLGGGEPGPASGTEVFDREWAVALMNRAVERLAAGQDPERFDALRPWLMGDAAASQAEAAGALGMSEGAFKVAVHRLRKQFREILRQEVAQTVDDEAEIDDELRYLCSVLGR